MGEVESDSALQRPWCVRLPRFLPRLNLDQYVYVNEGQEQSYLDTSRWETVINGHSAVMFPFLFASIQGGGATRARQSMPGQTEQ